MISFFHRTPTIVLDCFVADPMTYSSTPIVKASKTLPEWWKKLPVPKIKFDYNNPDMYPNNDKNMRNCYGFIELFKKGAVLENWCDINIRTTPDTYNYFYSGGSAPDNHPTSQFSGGFTDYHHIKLMSPWVLSEKTGVQFLFIGAEWNLDKYDIKVLPGVVDYRMNVVTHINMMLPRKNTEIYFKIGQPLVHIIPLSDKKLQIRNHLVTKEEFSKRFMNVMGSYNGWRSVFPLIKRNDQRAKEKCPFSNK